MDTEKVGHQNTMDSQKVGHQSDHQNQSEGRKSRAKAVRLRGKDKVVTDLSKKEAVPEVKSPSTAESGDRPSSEPEKGQSPDSIGQSIE
jgi:hypothetical protein